MFHLQCEAGGGRVVMTGFHGNTSRSLVASNYAVVTRSLPQCEPFDARIAGLLLHALYGTQFPHFLYEICKATPGLLGTLLMVATQTTVTGNDFDALAEAVPWVPWLRSRAVASWRLMCPLIFDRGGC